jgi:hypothetical protein
VAPGKRSQLRITRTKVAVDEPRRFCTFVPWMQLTASRPRKPEQTSSCAAGSAGPITDAAVMHASRCRPTRPEQSRSSSAGEPVWKPAGRLSPTTSTGGLAFSNGQYEYDWKTDKAWKGTCRSLILQLNDNTVQTALVQFS